jgi:hypothetical protein
VHPGPVPAGTHPSVRPGSDDSDGGLAVRPGSDDSDGGLGRPVTRATELLSGVLATLEPFRLTGPDAADLYRLFAAAERLSVAGKTLLAPRIDESGVWRDGGHRSPTVMLAELEGVPTGQARTTLEVGHRLAELPGTEEALRQGMLSAPKVAELSGAAVLDPGSEGTLLAGAADEPLQKVKERCRRVRSAVERRDPVATVRRIHAGRHFSSWTDAEGAFCYRGRDTADRGAKILERMQHTVGRLRTEARTTAPGGATPVGDPPTIEPVRALLADAFYLLMTGPADRTVDAGSSDSGEDPEAPDGEMASQFEFATAIDAPGGIADLPVGGERGVPGSNERRGGDRGYGPAEDAIDRPPTCSLTVRVDLDALLRGDVLPGEVCEIDNVGPIPVAMARDLANDSFLRLVFHRAGDIRAVSHLGRTINRRLRTALAHRDRCCVVPGCGVPYRLEIDHVVPFAQGGPTELSNLALLCHHHHYLKSYEGWTLECVGTQDDGSLTWAFNPLPPFGQEPDPDSG